jgi:hypothetical protein
MHANAVLHANSALHANAVYYMQTPTTRKWLVQ